MRDLAVKRVLLFGIAVCVAGFFAGSIVGTRADSITLPPPNLNFKNGPNVTLSQSKCLICHSADYVYMQPPLTRMQWTAEVTKMRKAFGAPIGDADVAPLVDYLMSQNGKGH
jgi:sulfite dehydrogenase (cytochrome) subunit B